MCYQLCFYVQVESIWIQAPNDVRVAQWDNEARQDTGLIDLSFPMTSDPVLGKWKINVLFRGVVTIQEFVVEEYGKLVKILSVYITMCELQIWTVTEGKWYTW